MAGRIRAFFCGWWLAMSENPQAEVEHYREIAAKIRQLARQTWIKEIADGLSALADRFDYMAKHSELEEFRTSPSTGDRPL